MDKPRKSFLVYLIGIYIFFVQSAVAAPLRLLAKQYWAEKGGVNYLANQIMFAVFVLAVVLIVQIIRYRKVWFFIAAGFFILNSIWNIVVIIHVYKNYLSVFDVFVVLNVACCVFLLNKKSLQQCDLFTEYYRQKKVEKEMRGKM